jgi:hypothetical protein
LNRKSVQDRGFPGSRRSRARRGSQHDLPPIRPPTGRADRSTLQWLGRHSVPASRRAPANFFRPRRIDKRKREIHRSGKAPTGDWQSGVLTVPGYSSEAQCRAAASRSALSPDPVGAISMARDTVGISTSTCFAGRSSSGWPAAREAKCRPRSSLGSSGPAHRAGRAFFGQPKPRPCGLALRCRCG